MTSHPQQNNTGSSCRDAANGPPLSFDQHRTALGIWKDQKTSVLVRLFRRASVSAFVYGARMAPLTPATRV